MIATTTILATAAVLSVVGAGVGAYAAIQQGQAQEAAAKYNSKVAQNNAIMAQQQSSLEAARIRRKNLQIIGMQRAAQAKSGVALDSGSAADVAYDSKVEGEMNALTALYTGKISANSSIARSKLDLLEGENAVTGSYFNAGSTILTGLGNASSAYGNYQLSQQPQF